MNKSLINNKITRKFIYYFLTFLVLLVFLLGVEFFLGRVNNVNIKRSERVKFLSETAPLIITTNHLLPKINDNFINEQRSSNLIRKFRTDEYGIVIGGVGSNNITNRILFLGGSTTENNEVEEEFRFPNFAGQFLSEITGKNFLGINAGVRGHTTQDSVNLYLNHPSPDIEKSNIVIMMHNINDRLRLSINGQYKSIINNDSRVTFSGFSSACLGVLFSFKEWLVFNTNIGYLLNEFMDKIYASSSKIIFINEHVLEKLPPLSDDLIRKFSQNYKNLAALAIANGQKPFFMTQPLGKKSIDQDRFNDEIRRIGGHEGVPVIDLAKEILRVDNYESLFYNDGIHFNNDGSRWASHVIAEALIKELKLVKLKKLNFSENCKDLKFQNKSFLNKSEFDDIFSGRYPSFNSDETKILFQVNKDESYISYYDLRSNKLVNLISDSDPDALEHPIWYDKENILYTRRIGDFGHVYLLNINDKKTRPLLKDKNIYSGIPSVFSDGSILFAGYRFVKDGKPSSSIYYMDSLKSNANEIFSNNAESWRPVFINKKEMLFINNKSGKYNIYKHNISSEVSKESDLLPSDAIQWDPNISNDSRLIAFAERRSSNFDIKIIDYLKTPNKSKIVVNGVYDEWDPSFSPSKTYLLYSVSGHNGDQIRAACIK